MTPAAFQHDAGATRHFRRLERRRSIIGSLVVFFVVVTTLSVLFLMMHPDYFKSPPTNWSDFNARLAQMANSPPSTEQQIVTQVVELAGAAGLFFLNLRFSFLIRRPRTAFTPGPGQSLNRLWWWSVLFANSLLYIPVLLANIIPWTGFRTFVNNHITPTSLLYVVSYGILIFAFTFFYVYVAFDPHQQADIIRKQGGYIPGIRPGPPTERYLARILNRITVPGGLYLAVVAVLPSLLMALWNIQGYPFYGTTLLIAVGVSLETMRQIDSQLMMRNYEGFLK